METTARVSMKLPYKLTSDDLNNSVTSLTQLISKFGIICESSEFYYSQMLVEDGNGTRDRRTGNCRASYSILYIFHTSVVPIWI